MSIFDMWKFISLWWDSILGNDALLFGVISSLIAGVILFIIFELYWKNKIAYFIRKKEFKESQLQAFYIPLYQFYREAYTRFELWKRDNLDTQLECQPFFESQKSENFVEEIFSTNARYASQLLIRRWSTFKAANDVNTRNMYRKKMVISLIREYHKLRRSLGLTYDEAELLTGRFRITL